MKMNIRAPKQRSQSSRIRRGAAGHGGEAVYLEVCRRRPFHWVSDGGEHGVLGVGEHGVLGIGEHGVPGIGEHGVRVNTEYYK
jgi:hypothetical protein